MANELTKTERMQIDRSLITLPTVPAARLRRIARELKVTLRELERGYGVVASLEDLEAIISNRDRPKRLGPDEYLCASKYQLAQVFRHYEKALPSFSRLPYHARVGIDVQCIRDSPATMEIFQLEAALFEDMAALWNEALRSSRVAQNPNASKSQNKHFNAMLRSAAKAAFNLLEGYLNGLACDILLTRTISTQDRIKLAEWDEANNQARFLSLRDKIHQYPKLAIGSDHPPLQESAVPEIQRILEMETRLRHALIHPRPQVEVNDLETFREAFFFELTLEPVSSLCDDVVSLIFLIAGKIGPEFGDVSDWLKKRNDDGLFPEETFF